MEQSMRRFTKVGIVLHISYPQLGRGDGPILECLERIYENDYFEAVEVAGMKDPQVREQAAGMIRMTHIMSAYGGQSRTLSAGLNIDDLDETGGVMTVDTLKEDIDEAHEMGCTGFSFLSDRYEEERKEQASEQLLKSIKELCRHAEKKGQVPIYCEVFDYDISKRTLIGPAVLAARYAGEIRKEHGNFSLLVDSNHIPMIHETIEKSVLPVKDYIIHTHMENTVIKSPDCETYRDSHPRFGFPSSENDVEELAHYLRTLKEIGLLGKKDRPAVSSEMKLWEDEPPEVVTANAEHTLSLTWELV